LPTNVVENVIIEEVPMGLKFVLVNQSKIITPDELVAWAEACQTQANEHFARVTPEGYMIGASARVATAQQPPAPDEISVLFSAVITVDALGLHEIGADGKPDIVIYPKLDEQDGVPSSTTLSHEILETLGDAECTKAAQGDDGLFRALEVADAVEADSYKIGDVLVSNFVLPPWFNGGAGPYDYLGLCKAPYEVRPGGYISIWDPVKGWIEKTNGEKRSARQIMHEQGVSRGAQRSQRGLVGAAPPSAPKTPLPKGKQK
jgi:hypothetical protein